MMIPLYKRNVMELSTDKFFKPDGTPWYVSIKKNDYTIGHTTVDYATVRVGQDTDDEKAESILLTFRDKNLVWNEVFVKWRDMLGITKQHPEYQEIYAMFKLSLGQFMRNHNLVLKTVTYITRGE